MHFPRLRLAAAPMVSMVVLLASIACVPVGAAPSAVPTAPPSAAATSDATATAASPAMAHVRALADEIGSRPAASPAELRGAEYVAGELRAMGLQPRIEPFVYPIFRDEGSSLSGPDVNVDANAMYLSSAGSVEGPLVIAGIGRKEELGANARGAIVLIERGQITFEEKVRNAAEAGAVGAVIYNNQPGLLQGSFGNPQAIPAVAIFRDQGRDLVGRASQPFRLDVRTTSLEETSWNVIADTRPDAASTVVVGGHMDSVEAGPGANDNASGTAVALEVMRHATQANYPGNVRFMAFGAEELGLLGSRDYARNPANVAGVSAMLNFDMVGVGNMFLIGGDDPLAPDSRQLVGRQGIPVADFPGGRGGSDHASFSSAGVPSLFFHVTNDPNYHTALDQSRFVTEANLSRALRAGVVILDDVARR